MKRHTKRITEMVHTKAYIIKDSHQRITEMVHTAHQSVYQKRCPPEIYRKGVHQSLAEKMPTQRITERVSVTVKITTEA
jgi:hypothetical protein